MIEYILYKCLCPFVRGFHELYEWEYRKENGVLTGGFEHSAHVLHQKKGFGSITGKINHKQLKWLCLSYFEKEWGLGCQIKVFPVFLFTTFQTHKIDPSGHYLRLKVWMDNQTLFYVPKLDEEISDLVRKYSKAL